MIPGDKVIWLRGSVGLTGTLIRFEHIPGADRHNRKLAVVETERGFVHEHPGNLRRLDYSFAAAFKSVTA